jgi:imidazolonepropionase-like amidohydrolase
MKNRFLVLVFGLMLLAGSASAQITEKARAGKFALVGGKVFTVTGGIIENGTVLIDGRTIAGVGTGLPTDGYEVINTTGKHVYPGLIESGSVIGLVEINAIDITKHDAEVGEFNPHIRAITSIDPHSVAIPVSRVNGVTTALSHPTGNGIAGKATLINLYGYTPDSMAVKHDVALHMGFPSSVKRGFWDQRDEKKVKEDFEAQMRQLNDVFDKAMFYNTMVLEYEKAPAGKTKPDRDLKMEALRDVVTGKLPVLITVNREQDILEALAWAKKRPELKVILNSVAEGWRVAAKIAEAKIPCLVGPVLRTTERDYDRYSRPYDNAGLLYKAGVVVAIRTGNNENIRNLPYHAGFAGVFGAANGFDLDKALEAITIVPARIFGVDNKIGSLEKGKIANVFITNGDWFEATTQVENVFIDGMLMPVSSRHTLLYEEFKKRDVR